MKDSIAALLFTFLIHSVSSAQYIKADFGVHSSAYANKIGLPIVDRKITGYSASIGLDHHKRKWFYLSSQIGLFQVGGIDRIHPTPGRGYDENGEFREKKNNIHLNTTFRAFIEEKKGLAFFLGAGPYLNIPTGSGRFENPFYRDFYSIKSYAGGKAETGFTADINRIRLGMTGAYLFSVTPSAESEALKLRNNNWVVSLFLGYRISTRQE
ncbi:MAG: hypothetical protein ABS46_01305 [Cytophagaceae bacterium SCN 52-12]|nr:MAG: hypothetical protein ABS46_01305 [Cytophagaceae bacterium SCN 52-12]